MHPYLYRSLSALGGFFTGGTAHFYLRRAADALPPCDPSWSWTRRAIYQVFKAIADNEDKNAS